MNGDGELFVERTVGDEEAQRLLPLGVGAIDLGWRLLSLAAVTVSYCQLLFCYYQLLLVAIKLV